MSAGWTWTSLHNAEIESIGTITDSFSITDVGLRTLLPSITQSQYRTNTEQWTAKFRRERPTKFIKRTLSSSIFTRPTFQGTKDADRIEHTEKFSH